MIYQGVDLNELASTAYRFFGLLTFLRSCFFFLIKKKEKRGIFIICVSVQRNLNLSSFLRGIRFVPLGGISTCGF